MCYAMRDKARGLRSEVTVEDATKAAEPNRSADKDSDVCGLRISMHLFHSIDSTNVLEVDS